MGRSRGEGDADSSVPGLRRRYVKVRSRGKRGFLEVFSAVDSKLDAPVTITVIPPAVVQDDERLERFRDEVRRLAQVESVHVAPILDVGYSRTKGVSYLVAPATEGESIIEWARRRHPTAAEVAEVGAQVAEGLAEAHEAGVLHRDLTPERVIITAEGYVRIVDFGVGRFVGGAAASRTTASGYLRGDAAWAAPEILEGGHSSPACDVFSLGAILRRALKEAGAADGDPKLTSVLKRAVSHSPDDRYPSARELHRALLGDGGSDGAPAPSPSSSSSFSPSSPSPPPPSSPRLSAALPPDPFGPTIPLGFTVPPRAAAPPRRPLSFAPVVFAGLVGLLLGLTFGGPPQPLPFPAPVQTSAPPSPAPPVRLELPPLPTAAAGLELGLPDVLAAGAGGPLADAAMSRPDRVKARLAAGDAPAGRDARGRCPLHLAAAAGSLTAVRLLLDAGAPAEVADPAGRTPLHLAAGGGHVDVIRALLEGGASAETRTATGATPLIYAAAEGRGEALRALLRAGADPSAVDALGRSALHMAARIGDGASVALLRAAGAVSAPDAEGLRPADHARINGYSRILEALSSDAGGR